MRIGTRRFLKSIALAAVGITLANLGFALVGWMAERIPDYEGVIKSAGTFLVALVVCIAFLYPMLSIYGLVRPVSESWQRLKRRG